MIAEAAAVVEIDQPIIIHHHIKTAVSDNVGHVAGQELFLVHKGHKQH